MASKKTINLAIPVPLLNEFNEVCSHYGHGKQKGMVLSAAILMFLEAHPAEQGRALERILIADVRSGVDALIDKARQEQARRLASPSPSDETDTAGKLSPEDNPPATAKAAKTARDAKQPLHELPKRSDEMKNKRETD